MKKIIIGLLFVLLCSPAMAQVQTLISGEIESGGYGGPILEVGQVNGHTGVFMGGQGGWIINHRFVLGGKGYGLINEIDIEDSPELQLEFGCGGILLEYIIDSDKLLHYSIQAMIGGGGLSYVEKDADQNNSETKYSSDGFFVIEPGASIILNVTKSFRIGAGAGYRSVHGISYGNLSDSDFSGVSAQIFLKFGSF